MTPQNDAQTNNNPQDSQDDKTIRLKRCPKHGTLYMPEEGCPDCAKEKGAAAS
jgi:hypothetical protein